MPGMLFALQVLAREIVNVTVCRCAKRALLRRWVTSFFICASLTRAAAVGGKFSTATGNPFFLFWPYPSFSHRPSLSGNCPWLYRLNCWPADSICKCGRQAALWLSAVVGLSFSLSLSVHLVVVFGFHDGWMRKQTAWALGSPAPADVIQQSGKEMCSSSLTCKGFLLVQAVSTDDVTPFFSFVFVVSPAGWLTRTRRDEICARPYLEVRHRMANDDGNHLAGLERDDSSNWMTAVARTGTGAGRGRWRGGRHLSFGCRPLDCHRSVATVRWRNCHHSSVYGQSASRKMVNKWMPNSIYSQKESKSSSWQKETILYWEFWFPARDSSRFVLSSLSGSALVC